MPVALGTMALYLTKSERECVFSQEGQTMSKNSGHFIFKFSTISSGEPIEMKQMVFLLDSPMTLESPEERRRVRY